MQLSHTKSVRGAVAALTAALLGSGAVSAQPAESIESSILLYNETNRVTALEGVAAIDKTFPGDRHLRAKLTYDGLTGASPNGAAPSNSIQTFTGPSGRQSYTVPPGETPLDKSFTDTRLAGDITYSFPLNRLTIMSGGAHLSGETDYFSFGINGGISRDFNHRNTTLSLSGALSHDGVSPKGGLPDPLTFLPPPSDNPPGEDEGEDDGGGGTGGSASKNTIDAVAGISQILSRSTIVRFNYSFSRISGYLTDPYKLISVVNNEQSSAPGSAKDYLYESRPGSRKKQAVFGELRQYVGGHVVDLSYRYFWDDWGIVAHTFDVSYRLPVGQRKYIQPRFRWYRQTQADFFHPFLVDGQAVPAHASADYRLSTFKSLTYGLAYSFPVGERSHMKLEAEYYTQLGDKSPPQAFGELRQFDLFPKLNVLMVRLGFGYDF